MASRKAIHISGHYVVSINTTRYAFHVRTLNSKKLKESNRIELYIVLKTQRPSDTVF